MSIAGVGLGDAAEGLCVAGGVALEVGRAVVGDGDGVGAAESVSGTTTQSAASETMRAAMCERGRVIIDPPRSGVQPLLPGNSSMPCTAPCSVP